MMPADLMLSPAPHRRPVTSVPQVMRTVLIALVPGLVAYVVSFGAGVAVNLAIAVATAAVSEALWTRLRGRNPIVALADLSAVVTGVLLTFALPPLLPWWVPAMAAATAIVLGKQIFGGLGANPFNPAMVGYVIVLISFPAEMLQWLPPRGSGLTALEPSVIDHIVYALSGQLPASIDIDAVTQATPLDVARLGLGNMQTLGEIRVGPLFGQFAGAGWQLTNVLIGCGGAYLLYRGIIRWHIPVAVMGGLLVPAAALYLFDTARFLPPTFHLLSGATMLGAFFIATDPVTAPGNPHGRLWYGTWIGLLVYAIRTWGGYPDGFAFAVLLMNAAVPLIDRYSTPRIYGHR